MKKSTSMFALAASSAAFVTALALPSVALAELSFNVGAVSDYRYRGISQSRLKPAVQGGVDFSTESGFYLGTWASSIKWIKDVPGAGNAGVEIDLYGGYKAEIVKGLGYDVGVLTYQYPSNKLNPKAETTEIYGALSYGPGTLKYSHAVTNTFANTDSKGSFYVDLSASFEVGPIVLAPHVGYQKIKGPAEDAASYTDYSLTASYEVVKGLALSLAVVGTDADKAFYVPGANANSTKFLGKSAAVLGVKYSF
jgi:uncharacterized protein (TIGR02001 family)